MTVLREGSGTRWLIVAAILLAGVALALILMLASPGSESLAVGNEVDGRIQPGEASIVSERGVGYKFVAIA